MGTTLQNGVYLPNEGERNCYAGLKTNWEILDQKVADVTALQQAVAGALHREIVESLPTTDIDPNTIYMVLSGTSATENVYNEFMYVNNAWELIGTSATDLTNYYTKSEVDGKLLLKASASDLTSHTGDTTIHVTTADKTKWNNQTYVFRYSSTALVASSTNANSLLDNTDNLKVGDKVIDSSGVLFSVTAIDTANSTFTIGTALVDLAQDSDVVHKSGDETISGVKTFNDNPLVGNNNTNITISNRQVTANGFSSAPTGSGYSFMQLRANVNYADSSPSIATTVVLAIQENAYSDGKNAGFYPNSNNIINLGISGKRWANVYATNYYYGGSEIEFSQKFVTTDTNQTISGSKTFDSNTYVYNSDNTATTPALILKNSKTSKGSTSEIGGQLFRFFDKNNNLLSEIESTVTSNGASELRLSSNTLDSNNQNVKTGLTLISNKNGLKRFCPTDDGNVSCGYSTLKWSGVYATNYYYGNDNVEFSTKFVTTDTDQSVSGQKVFNNINAISSSSEIGVSGGNNSFKILDKNKKTISRLEGGTFSGGMAYSYLLINNGSDEFNGVSLYQPSANLAQLRPYSSTLSLQLGASNRYFSDCYTSKINGLEPSSLSLPSGNASDVIDISSYITDLSGNVNNYTAPVNGYLSFTFSSGARVQIYPISGGGVSSSWVSGSSAGIIRGFMPVLKNSVLRIVINATTMESFYFIPCQGNV